MSDLSELGDAAVAIFDGIGSAVMQVAQHANPAVNAFVQAMFMDMPQLVMQHATEVGSQQVAGLQQASAGRSV